MSKKNLKNSAQNSNYKIEALEPRFMMDANVDLDGFGNQIDNFSSVVENRVDTLNLNLSDFGLNSSYNAVSQLLGGVGNSVETALQTIYGNYRNSLSSQVSSVELNALIIGLAASKDTLPAESLPLEIDEISFAKEGNDTLKVNLAYSRNVSVTELNLTNIGLNVENGFALNVSANISIALDFNQNNNNDWMENADDIGLTADVSEVNVVVPNMGVFATFMNLSVDEENDGVDDLSYIRSSDATSSELDLEFTIAAGANLPFSLPSDEYIEDFVKDIDRTKIMQAKDIMTRSAALGFIKDGPNVALKEMRANGLSSLFIVNRNMILQGIINVDDTINAIKEKQSIEDILKKDYFTTRPDTYIQDLMAFAADTKYPIAVVDENEKLLGIIVRSSILAGLV